MWYIVQSIWQGEFKRGLDVRGFAWCGTNCFLFSWPVKIQKLKPHAWKVNFLLFAKHEPKNCLSDFSWCIISTFWFTWIVHFTPCEILIKLWKYEWLINPLLPLNPCNYIYLFFDFFRHRISAPSTSIWTSRTAANTRADFPTVSQLEIPRRLFHEIFFVFYHNM